MILINTLLKIFRSKEARYSALAAKIPAYFDRKVSHCDIS